MLAFSHNPLNRSAQARAQADALAERRDARSLAFREFKPLVQVEGGFGLAQLEMGDPRLDPSSRIFLGLVKDAPLFAMNWSGEDAPPGHKFIDMRSFAMAAGAVECGIAGQAKSFLEWHARHPFCAACGSPSHMIEGGAKRLCTNAACGAMHFPRTDPVAMMWVTCGDRALIARSPHFPPGVYSALAGFIEPGETLEAAAARETWEEVGLRAIRVEYQMSQAWPFSSSLMLGCFVEVADGPLALEAQEIDDALFVSRDAVKALLARSQDVASGDGAMRLPPPISLAHALAQRWADMPAQP